MRKPVPNLKVLFWNVQNLGNENVCRSRQARLFFLASVVQAYQADVVCIQELTQGSIANYYLQSLQEILNSLPAPLNNWYYDWIKGALAPGGAHPANYPYSQAADLAWDSAHFEGYAVFWNQNIAKLTLKPAPPIQPLGAPAAVPSAQSGESRMPSQIGFGMPPVYVPFSVAVPAGGIVVPGVALPFIIPAGTTVPGAGPSAGPAGAAAGAVIPAGTTIGPAGVTLAALTNNVYPVVVPGNFVLTDALTLPPAGAIVTPQYALSLVMFGRDSAAAGAGPAPATFVGDISAATANFAPGGGAPPFNWIEFTRGAGHPASRTACRRPVTLTIEVNRPAHAAAADRLVPIIAYHAPSAAPASSAGMQRAAYSREMYQAYDWTAGNWIDCNHALLGSDFNVIVDSVAYAYNAFTGGFGGPGGTGGGAACTMAVNNPAVGGSRANNPLNKSVVGLTYGVGGPPVYSAALADFRTLAIDNCFYRGLGGGVVAANTLLLDLLVSSTVGGNLTGPPIVNCLNTLAMVNTTTAVAHGLPIAPLANINSPLTTLFDMQQGQFGALPAFDAQNTPARRAAEFVNLFVSDHLPVAIEFNL